MRCSTLSMGEGFASLCATIAGHAHASSFGIALSADWRMVVHNAPVRGRLQRLRHVTLMPSNVGDHVPSGREASLRRGCERAAHCGAARGAHRARCAAHRRQSHRGRCRRLCCPARRRLFAALCRSHNVAHCAGARCACAAAPAADAARRTGPRAAGTLSAAQ